MSKYQWTRLNETGERPPATDSPSMVLHSHELIVFGGLTQSQPLVLSSDIWVYSLVRNTWHQTRVSGSVPLPGLFNHAATCFKDKMYVIGGWTERGARREVFEVCLKTLFVRPSEPLPFALSSHKAITFRNQLIVYGGWTFLDNRSEGELLICSPKSLEIHPQSSSSSKPKRKRFDSHSKIWTRIKTTGVCPPQLQNYSIVITDESLVDSMNSSSSSSSSALTYNSSSTTPSLLIFGGRTDGPFRNDLWEMSLVDYSWQKIKTTGIVPPPACNHTAVWRHEIKSMITFGGENSRSAVEINNKALIFKKNNLEWSEVEVSPHGALPEARKGARGVLYRGKKVIFGGYSPETMVLFNDLWELHEDKVKEKEGNEEDTGTEVIEPKGRKRKREVEKEVEEKDINLIMDE